MDRIQPTRAIAPRPVLHRLNLRYFIDANRTGSREPLRLRLRLRLGEPRTRFRLNGRPLRRPVFAGDARLGLDIDAAGGLATR